VVDRKPAGLQVDPRRAIDVELLGSHCSVAVLPLFNLITDRLWFGIVDKAQAFVALAKPLLEERKEQAVALGRSRIDRANMHSRINRAYRRDAHADRRGDPPSRVFFLTVRG
jgi:hypothetical protein